MNPMEHPPLADRLAAAYALGTLRGGARRRFEALARQSPGLRALALVWQERLAAMTELQTEEAPSPNVWKRIEIELKHEAQAAALLQQRERATLRGVAFWRGLAVAGACVAVLTFTLAGYTGWQLRASPEIRYVAMLQDEHAQPAVLVTFDARHGTLTARRVAGFHEAADRSLELWALPVGGAPRSLGVLADAPQVTLKAAPGQSLDLRALAISLEPKGGAPAGSGPTGPVLFQGAWVRAT
jgi:anti-sigma-K factor RskA